MASHNCSEAVFVGALLIAVGALGQTSKDAERQALVEQAQNAAKAGDDEQALLLLEMPLPGTPIQATQLIRLW